MFHHSGGLPLSRCHAVLILRYRCIADDAIELIAFVVVFFFRLSSSQEILTRIADAFSTYETDVYRDDADDEDS